MASTATTSSHVASSSDAPLAGAGALLACLLLGAALLRLLMVCADRNLLLDQGLVQDDAFYYYVIARHLLENGVSTFDGFTPTNGFHPLWEALCLPVFALWHGDMPVRIMLALAAACDLGSLVVFYHLLRTSTRHGVTALCGVAILAFHGTIVRTWFNGLETALSLFCLLLFFRHLQRLRSGPGSSLAQHAGLGGFAALAFLARTDNAVIALVAGACFYLPRLAARETWHQAILAAAVFLALTAPWLLWNLEHFGSIVQVSGQIRDNTWLSDSAVSDEATTTQLLYGAVTALDKLRIVFEKMFSPVFAPTFSGLAWIVLTVGVCLQVARRAAGFRHYLRGFFPVIAGILVLFFYHAGVRHFVRGWYNAPVLLALTLICCGLLDAALDRWPAAARFALAATLAVLFAAFSPWSYLKNPEHGQTDPRIATAEWLNAHTAPGSLVGAANAGILGYYTERPVVNLDGVVNERAFHARLANALPRYIAETQITYLADHKGSIAHLCADNAFYRCEKIAGAGQTWVMQVIREPAAAAQ